MGDRALYLLNDQRNRRLRDVLRATVRLLNRVGIAPVLLKPGSPGAW